MPFLHAPARLVEAVPFKQLAEPFAGANFSPESQHPLPLLARFSLPCRSLSGDNVQNGDGCAEQSSLLGVFGGEMGYRRIAVGPEPGTGFHGQRMNQMPSQLISNKEFQTCIS